jgi:hypothetical protein
MTGEERKMLRLAFSSIFADLRNLQDKVDSLEKALESHPDLYAQYRKALDAARANTTNVHATLLQHLDKTLLKSTN